MINGVEEVLTLLLPRLGTSTCFEVMSCRTRLNSEVIIREKILINIVKILIKIRFNWPERPQNLLFFSSGIVIQDTRQKEGGGQTKNIWREKCFIKMFRVFVK